MRAYDLNDSVQLAPQNGVVDFHGAAIIDENGIEQPITEEMVQTACQKLSELWVVPKDVVPENIAPEILTLK